MSKNSRGKILKGEPKERYLSLTQNYLFINSLK